MVHQDSEFWKLTKSYQHSYMSDTKWRKLFKALANLKEPIEHAEWKHVGAVNDYTFTSRLPKDGEYLDNRFADCHFQPDYFSRIEWIRIPATYKIKEGVGYEKYQDLDRIENALIKAGSFKYYRTKEDLKIVGYE